MRLENDFAWPSASSRPSTAFFCHLSSLEDSKQEKIINSNYCLINTEISAACSACGPQLDAISKFGQLAWAAVFPLFKTDGISGICTQRNEPGAASRTRLFFLGKSTRFKTMGKREHCVCVS